MTDGPERRQQLDALSRLPARMALDHGTPSEAAADIVMRYAAGGRTRRRLRVAHAAGPAQLRLASGTKSRSAGPI